MNRAARLAVRQVQSEWMDRPDLDAQSHSHALRGLARLNRWSRAAAAIWRPLEQLARSSRRPLRVLDIATGGGDVLCNLALRAKRAGLSYEFAGCDISPTAIAFARERASRRNLEIAFFHLDVLEDPLPNDFEVMISSLFLHHLSEEQAIALLRKMADASRDMIVISDLRRNTLGLCLAYSATQLLTRSPVVHFDGPRSVRNAFTTAEVRAIAEQAGLANAKISNCWPQRLLLCWRNEQVSR